MRATGEEGIREISPQTAKVLAIIRDEMEKTGQFPERRIIADRMRWQTTSGVSETIGRLVYSGHLTRQQAPAGTRRRYVYSLPDIGQT
jgi:DNA-binding MarR family transcriptional regulator